MLTHHIGLGAQIESSHPYSLIPIGDVLKRED